MGTSTIFNTPENLDCILNSPSQISANNSTTLRYSKITQYLANNRCRILGQFGGYNWASSNRAGIHALTEHDFGFSILSFDYPNSFRRNLVPAIRKLDYSKIRTSPYIRLSLRICNYSFGNSVTSKCCRLLLNVVTCHVHVPARIGQLRSKAFLKRARFISVLLLSASKMFST